LFKELLLGNWVIVIAQLPNYQLPNYLLMSHTNELQLIENQGWDERILVCRNGRLVDTFIVVTGRFVVLVDTVINPQTAAQMLDYARPYLTNGRQLLVINTHADYDHCWGNQLFAAIRPLRQAQGRPSIPPPSSAATSARPSSSRQKPWLTWPKCRSWSPTSSVRCALRRRRCSFKTSLSSMAVI
jgi:hypothetical protein